MSYLVFARKFRPQTFEDVVGQSPIVTTLKNAIKQERIPQNFLFAGPRGIGKTSTARILAKALNCAKGPAEEPCGKCTSCVEITQGNSMDVLEIDGASNRGIDEIRNLRETVKFKPVNGRYKIYIIDEVHMLTTEAFNALLKTLEEPPPHVKFIFATTESHKVPLTILSRCHRFNFKRISVQETYEKLEEIAKAEKLKFEKNALFLIAKASDGALRDAEGLLDQLASFSGDKIKEEDVLLMLGLASEELYFTLLSAIKQKDTKKVFEMVNDLYENGRDLVQFAKGLFELFRHLALVNSADKMESFIEMSEEGIAELKKRKNDFTRGELLLAMSLLANLQNQLRRNLAPPKLLLETALLKLIHIDGLANVSDLASAAPEQRPTPAAWSAPSAPAEKKSAPNTSSFSGFEPTRASAPKTAAPSNIKASATAVKEAPAASGPSASLNDIERIWPQVIEYVKAKRMSIGIFLSESQPVEMANHTLTLGLPTEFQFHKEMLEKNGNREIVEEAFQVVGQKRIRVQFVVTRPDQEVHTAPAAAAPAPSSAPSAEDSGKLTDIVTEALNIFQGAKVVRKE